MFCFFSHIHCGWLRFWEKQPFFQFSVKRSMFSRFLCGRRVLARALRPAHPERRSRALVLAGFWKGGRLFPYVWDRAHPPAERSGSKTGKNGEAGVVILEPLQECFLSAGSTRLQGKTPGMQTETCPSARCLEKCLICRFSPIKAAFQGTSGLLSCSSHLGEETHEDN